MLRRFLTDCSTPTTEHRHGFLVRRPTSLRRLGGLRRLAPTPHADRSRGSLLPSQPAPLLKLRSAASKGHPHPLRQATGANVSTLVSPSSCRCISPCYIASRKPSPDSGQSSLLLPAEAIPPQASRARVPMQIFNPQPDGAQVPDLVTHPATYQRIHRDHRHFAGPTSSQGRPSPSFLVRDTAKDGCTLLMSTALLSKAAHVLPSRQRPRVRASPRQEFDSLIERAGAACPLAGPHGSRTCVHWKPRNGGDMTQAARAPLPSITRKRLISGTPHNE